MHGWQGFFITFALIKNWIFDILIGALNEEAEASLTAKSGDSGNDFFSTALIVPFKSTVILL